MENYQLVNQWASKISADKAFRELLDFKDRYSWAKLPESTLFLSQMAEDLPKILNIIKLQEKQNAILRYENSRLTEYIEVNRMADELMLDEIKSKYPLIDI
jgi:hypothetical protein